jgi:hypothetical protein
MQQSVSAGLVTILSNHRRTSEPKGMRPHREEALMGPAAQNGKICYCAAESLAPC